MADLTPWLSAGFLTLAGTAASWAWYRYRELHTGTIQEQQKIIDDLRQDVIALKADYAAQRTQNQDMEIRHDAEMAQFRQETELLRARYEERLTSKREEITRSRLENEALRGRIELLEVQVSQFRAGIHPIFTSPELFTTACVVADYQGRILSANPFVTFLLHWLERDLLGRHIHRLIPPRLRATHDAGWARAAAQDIPPALERSYATFALTKQGEEIPVVIRLTGWRDDGNWIFCALISRRPGGPPDSSDDILAYRAAPQLPIPVQVVNPPDQPVPARLAGAIPAAAEPKPAVEPSP